MPSTKPVISVFQTPKRSYELKQLDRPEFNSALNTTGTVTLLNAVLQGTNVCNRIGRKINIRSIAMDWSLRFIRAIGNIDTGRIAIIYDVAPNGALPVLADIFRDIDEGAVGHTSAMSGINLNNGSRFKVLFDKRLCLPIINDVATTAIAYPSDKNDLAGNMYRKIGLETSFNQNANGDITDIDTGGLYLVTFGDTAAASEGFSVECHTRIRFNDN